MSGREIDGIVGNESAAAFHSTMFECPGVGLERPVEALSCRDNGWVVEVEVLEFDELGPFPTGDYGPRWPMEGPPLHRLPFSVINARRTLRPDPMRPLRSDCQVASDDLCRSKP